MKRIEVESSDIASVGCKEEAENWKLEFEETSVVCKYFSIIYNYVRIICIFVF